MFRVVDQLPSVLSIREVSQRSGCAASTLRYYEAEGIITALPRTETATRTYSVKVLAALEVITALRGAGFGIQDIRKLLGVKQPQQSLEARLKLTLQVLDDFSAVLAERHQAIEQAEALLTEWRRELSEVASGQSDLTQVETREMGDG